MATVLLPFLSFMISDFNVAPNQDEIGRYSGYLVGSFMLGQLIFSYVWGTISDRLGRRPILLVGLIMTAFSFLSFGFSTSYTMAIVLRLINGSVNGIVGVCKTYLSEITDNTNQAKGFAFLGVMRGLGMVIILLYRLLAQLLVVFFVCQLKNIHKYFQKAPCLTCSLTLSLV